MGHSDLLLLEPPCELIFVGPFTRQIQTFIKITNPDKMKNVLFKIKTTSPKLYCVRPNVGQLKPLESAIIKICLQPFIYDVDGKHHKFLIQAAHAPMNIENMADFWKVTSPSEVWDAKIKCVLCLKKEVDEVGQQNESVCTNIKGFANENEFSHSKGGVEYVDVLSRVLDNEPTRQIGQAGDEVNKELTQLYQKVSLLEKEKTVLKQEVLGMKENKVKDEAKQRQMLEQSLQLKIKRLGNVYVLATIFTMVAAVVGGCVGKYVT